MIEHCHAVAAAHGRPGAPGSEFVAWGEPSGGLRAGLLTFTRVASGDRLSTWVVIRNVSTEALTAPFAFSWNTTRVVAHDSRGTAVEVANPELRGGDAIVQCVLAPGEQIEIQPQPVQFGGNPGDSLANRVNAEPGRYAIQFDLGRADLRPGAASRPRLVTGLATVEVTPAREQFAGVGFTRFSGETVRVCGTFEDSSGEPIAGMVLWIMGPDNRLNLHSKPTGKDGRFEINQVPVGTSWCVVLPREGQPNVHSEVVTIGEAFDREIKVELDGEKLTATLLPSVVTPLEK
jgi:hypothetical protein